MRYNLCWKKHSLYFLWRMGCEVHAGEKRVQLQGACRVQASIIVTGTGGYSVAGVTIHLVLHARIHRLCSGIFHLQPFLLLGCDSLWNQMFRIITVICEFLCIHTLLIWQSCYFFFSFPIHVHKCDSQAAWCNYFSGLGKRMKKIFSLIKEFQTCLDDRVFTLGFRSKLIKLLDGDLLSLEFGAWRRFWLLESLP